MKPRLAALSIDLDEVRQYAAIHGLDGAGWQDGAIYRDGLPRFRHFLAELGIQATFFVVGADARANAEALTELVAAGHEVANHSFDHFYDLSRRPRPEIHEQIRQATRAIEEACGVRPVGFRAPGYTITDEMLDVLVAQGYRYDSSVFPSAPYYLAKAAALGLHRIAGRLSHSVLDDPRILLAPGDPYRVGRPLWRSGRGVVELPIGVTRSLRLPFIGTSLIMGGRFASPWLARTMIGRPFVNLELHGIDLVASSDRGVDAIARYQPDLRVSLERKERALRAAILQLRKAGYRFVRLDEAADSWGGAPGAWPPNAPTRV